MSAAYAVSHVQGEVMVTPTRLEDTRTDLQEIISDLLALKMMARDGIQTYHSQHKLVEHLSPKELAAVARGVSLAEKRSQPIFNRPANLNSQESK